MVRLSELAVFGLSPDEFRFSPDRNTAAVGAAQIVSPGTSDSGRFDGLGSGRRDLTNQMLSAADYSARNAWVSLSALSRANLSATSPRLYGVTSSGCSPVSE